MAHTLEELMTWRILIIEKVTGTALDIIAFTSRDTADAWYNENKQDKNVYVLDYGVYNPKMMGQ
jgi:hypothetical protein